MSTKTILLSVLAGFLVGLVDVMIRPFFAEPFVWWSLVIPAMLVPLMWDQLGSSLIVSVCIGLVLDTFAFSNGYFFAVLPFCAWGAYELARRLLTNQSQYVYVLCAGCIRLVMVLMSVISDATLHVPHPWVHWGSVGWALLFDLVVTAGFFSIVHARSLRAHRYGDRLPT